MKRLLTLAATACLALGMNAAANAAEFSLAYFMSPKHPMNKAVFTPFAEKLAEVSGGKLTVKQFPAGALNSVPPKQYSILLDGVADIAFALPGYTGSLFPKTSVVTLPTVCDTAPACTTALLNARDELEKEFNAKVLALWSNAPPVLITKDKPVRSVADLAGLKVRVTQPADAPYTEALGASAVAQPVTVINQNLANGVIDAIAIDPSAIGSFKLHEPGNYVTTYYPGSGSPFVLLMNRGVYDGLSDEEKGWVDAAADESLSIGGGVGYEKSRARGMKIAKEAGLEIIELPAAEKKKMDDIANKVLAAAMDDKVGDKTVAEILKMMEGM